MAPASTDTSARSYTLSFLISTLRTHCIYKLGVLRFPDQVYSTDRAVSLFGDDDIFVESNMIKLRSQNPAAYAVTQEQEVGAALQCLSRKEGIPYTMVSFEVFNRNRKWSDKDVTLLTLLGHCIGDLLNYSE